MTDGLALAAVIALVFVNAFFVAAEFAIVTIRRARVDALVRSGSRRAKLLSAILGDLDAHISAIQLAITAVGLAIGWLGWQPGDICRAQTPAPSLPPGVGEVVKLAQAKMNDDVIAISVTLPAENKTIKLRDENGWPVWRQGQHGEQYHGGRHKKQ